MAASSAPLPPLTPGRIAHLRAVLLRRVMAWTGLMLSGFLFFHFAVAAFGLHRQSFEALSESLERQRPWTTVLEVVFVFVPLAVHALVGFYIMRKEGLAYRLGKRHSGGDLRYALQRASGAILAAFALFHVGTMHRWGFHLLYRMTGWEALSRYAGGGLFDPQRAYASVAAAFAGGPEGWGGEFVSGFYLLGLVAAVYHATNGTATVASLLKWTVGLGPGQEAEPSPWLPSAILTAGLLLALLGLAGWAAFALGFEM